MTTQGAVRHTALPDRVLLHLPCMTEKRAGSDGSDGQYKSVMLVHPLLVDSRCSLGFGTTFP